MTGFRYYAFISYNSRDAAWGRKLQRKLEHFSMPATLCRERGWKREPINPVFFAPSDIQPGPLDEELKGRLRASRHLIVICSPNSARSRWVGQEIAYFHELGRDNNIHFFIVAGTPNSDNPDTECLHPVIRELGLPEILGANVHERTYRWPWLNRERAYVQLISKLLGVEFDSIWKRHRRQLIAKITAWCIGFMVILITLGYVWVKGQPFDATVRIHEASIYNPNLPPMHNALVKIVVGEEVKTDTIEYFKGESLFRNIPAQYLGKYVRIGVMCPDFLSLDTVMKLERELTLNLYRDPKAYGCVRVEVYDFDRRVPIVDTKVVIEQFVAVTDSVGIAEFSIPLHYQRQAYQLRVPEYFVVDSCVPSTVVQTIALE